MLKPWLLAVMFSAGLTVTGTTEVRAQEYPSKPIRIMSTPPGGQADFVARLVAQGIGESFGWSVIVDNRPSGFVQGELLAKAPPDGYTTMLTGGSFTIGPLMEKAPYDVAKDFSPVTLIITSPSLLIVHPSLPIKSAKDLIALAKAKPGQLNFSTSGSGGFPHLAAELFKFLAGVNIVRINYRGAGLALTGVLTGEVQLMFATAGSAVPHVQSGRLRALGVTSAKPSALFPGMPTIAASLPGYEFETRAGIMAPVQTPQAVISRLSQAIVKVINRPDIKQKFLDIGTEVVGSTPEQYATVIKSELATWEKVIKQAGLRMD